MFVAVVAGLVGHHIEVCKGRIRNMIHSGQEDGTGHGFDGEGCLYGR